MRTAERIIEVLGWLLSVGGVFLGIALTFWASRYDPASEEAIRYHGWGMYGFFALFPGLILLFIAKAFQKLAGRGDGSV
jgi:hypothetical protein